MSSELVYAQSEYINQAGEKEKVLKPIGEINNYQLYLYMFPSLELYIEPSEDYENFTRVLVQDTYLKDGEEITKRYLIGSTKQTQYQKYLNLNMFRDGTYIIKEEITS